MQMVNNISEPLEPQMEQMARLCDKVKPLLSVNCLTYNHAPYLRDALESFVNQQTDFPFVVVVHDDASTDGTADIVREYAEKYPERIMPFIETENQYSKRDGSLQRRVNACLRGRYVAFCEGDDWWSDPLKLQKQVDFLEANPDYAMCYTGAEIFSQQEGRIVGIWEGSAESFSELVENNSIPTMTAVVRYDVLMQYTAEVPRDPRWLMGDLPMWLWIAAHGKIKFMDCLTACYRVLEESASHSHSLHRRYAFELSAIDIRRHFVERYPELIDDTTLGNVRRRTYEKLLRDAMVLGDDVFVAEARAFLRDCPLRLKLRLCVRCPRVMTPLLRLWYRIKGKL